MFKSQREAVEEMAQREATQREDTLREQEALRAYKKAVLANVGRSQARMHGTREGSAMSAATAVMNMLCNEADLLVYEINAAGAMEDAAFDRFALNVFEIIKGTRSAGFAEFPSTLKRLEELKAELLFTEEELDEMERENNDRLDGEKLDKTLIFDEDLDNGKELYFDPETGDQFEVPVELVRDFSRAQKVGNKND